eukprot:2305774-Rhodomonas_salina.1
MCGTEIGYAATSLSPRLHVCYDRSGLLCAYAVLLCAYCYVPTAMPLPLCPYTRTLPLCLYGILIPLLRHPAMRGPVPSRTPKSVWCYAPAKRRALWCYAMCGTDLAYGATSSRSTYPPSPAPRERL